MISRTIGKQPCPHLIQNTPCENLDQAYHDTGFEMNLIHRMASKVLRTAREWHLRRRAVGSPVLQSIVSDSNAKVQAIGNALQESLSRQLSTEELNAVMLIERRRSELLRSKRTLTKVDFGAGGWGGRETRAKSEMEKEYCQSPQLVRLHEPASPDSGL